MDIDPLKFMGGKDVERESNIVNNKTSYTEIYKYNYFYNVDGIHEDQRNPIHKENINKYNGWFIEYILVYGFVVIVN